MVLILYNYTQVTLCCYSQSKVPEYVHIMLSSVDQFMKSPGNTMRIKYQKQLITHSIYSYLVDQTILPQTNIAKQQS